MGTHPNAEVQRAVFDAFRRKDMAKASELIAEDVVVHMSGNNKISGTYKGRDEFFKVMGRGEELSGGLERDLHDIAASDEHSIALVRLSALRGGKRITWNGANIVHIRDGRIAEVWFLSDDPSATDEAFS